MNEHVLQRERSEDVSGLHFMMHGSLFAGIGGFDLGFERAGWETIWQVEIETYRRAVLERHFPEAQRFAEIRDCGAVNLTGVDCITAGVPCQDVSVAGKRTGLKGRRTGLFFEFTRILRELRPAWFVFENVPGLFSSNRGRDFAEVLRVLMVECGYGICWRVFDSRFFGVAQRRRRVFIVGRFGEPCPPEVLFESACGPGDSAKGGEAHADVAYAVTARARATGGKGCSNYVARALPNSGCSSGYRYDPNGEKLIAATLPADHRFTTDSNVDNLQPITALIGAPSDAERMRDIAGVSEGLDDSAGMAWPLLPAGLDSARYRALGDAVTVQVAAWIARRIARFLTGGYR